MINCRQCDWQAQGFCGFWWNEVSPDGFCNNVVARKDVATTTLPSSNEKSVTMTDEDFLVIAHHATCKGRGCSSCVLNGAEYNGIDCSTTARNIAKKYALQEGIILD